jgi:hypothetical protein
MRTAANDKFEERIGLVEEERITGIQLFESDDSHGLPNGACAGEYCNCRYGMLRITCCGHIGWGECVLSGKDECFDFVQWSSFLLHFRNPTLLEAYETIELLQGKWGATKAGLVRAALDDIAGQLINVKYEELVMAGIPNKSTIGDRGSNAIGHAVSLPSRQISREHSANPLDTASLIHNCLAYYEVI